MLLRGTSLAVLIGLTAAVAPPAPALAAPAEGELDALVTDFFVQADQAWYGTPPAAFSAGALRGGHVAPAARQLALSNAQIAQDAKADLGLLADDIATHVTNVETSASLNRYEFDSAVSTQLSWNVGELGDSVLADDYTVVVTRSAGDWTIADVTLTPAPPEDEEPAPPPEEEPVPPCKPGEVCDGETATGGIDLSEGRAKARALQRAGKGQESVGRGTGGNQPSAHSYNPSAAATYALYWSGVDVFWNPLYNPAYPKQSNNCTNFASQAMRAGGWRIKDGVNPDDHNNWTPDLYGPRGPSKSWSVSGWLRTFGLDYTDRAVQIGWEYVDLATQMWSMTKGDLYFLDWDPNGWPDGTIDHTMVVTGTFTAPSSPDFREPIISQNSNHRRNVPLYIQIKRATAIPPGESRPEHNRIAVSSVRVKTSYNS